MANHGWAGTSLNLSRYVLCRPTKTAEAAFQMFSFIPKILFTAVLLMQNCKRTVNQVMSVNPNFSCPPFLALLRGVPLRTPKRSTERVVLPKFLCKFAFRKLGADGKPN